MATGKCCLLKPQQVSSETEVVLKGLGDGRCCRFKFLTVTVHLVYLSGTYQLRDAHSIPMLQWTQNESVYESAKPLLSMIKACSPFSAVSLPFYLEALRGMLTAHHHGTTSLLDESNFWRPTCHTDVPKRHCFWSSAHSQELLDFLSLLYQRQKIALTFVCPG